VGDVRLGNDDELKTISSRFLGFPGWDLPFQARYVDIAVGFGLTLLAFTVEAIYGFGLSFTLPGWYRFAATMGAVVFVTRWLGRQLTPETPFVAVIATFVHEVRAPREGRPVTVSLDPTKVKRS
jgi:hypothetical protein